jgi:5'-methylthioadenosine phosphorylase
MFHQQAADIINMSAAPEVIMANETGNPYSAIAMSSGYDGWKEDESLLCI